MTPLRVKWYLRDHLFTEPDNQGMHSGDAQFSISEMVEYIGVCELFKVARNLRALTLWIEC